ncbi:hypothetical protein ACIQLK_02450 [Microbacterium sp. NPDC091382]|uniref:hypothetical protein n=1 Tax=Microbacterium sp. NPDC091382 TaxID=3364210 RepID=UPI00382013FE
MHTTHRASIRLGRLVAVGFGFALLWTAAAIVLDTSDARADDGSDGGLLGGVTRIVEDAAAPVADAVVAPVSEKLLAPVTDKVVKPVADTVVKPVADTVVKPVTDKVVKPVTDTVVKPVTDKVVKPVTDKVIKPVTDRVVATVKPVTGAVVAPVVDAVRPVVDPVVDVVDPVIDTVLPPIVDTGTPGTDAGGSQAAPAAPPVIEVPAAVGTGSPAPIIEIAGSDDAPAAVSPAAALQPTGASTIATREAFLAAVSVGTVVDVSVIAVKGAASVAPDDVPAPAAPSTGTGALVSASSGGAAGLFAVLPLGLPLVHRAWARRGRPRDQHGLPAPFFDTDVSPD